MDIGHGLRYWVDCFDRMKPADLVQFIRSGKGLSAGRAVNLELMSGPDRHLRKVTGQTSACLPVSGPRDPA